MSGAIPCPSVSPGVVLAAMDVLDDLLAGTRARGGVFNLTIMDPPWGLHIRDEAPLALATLVRGSAWIPATARAGPDGGG